MPIGLNINNPQTQEPIAEISPTISTGPITFGGNALGTGASTATTSSPDLSTILLYGAIGLFVIWILKRIEG